MADRHMDHQLLWHHIASPEFDLHAVPLFVRISVTSRTQHALLPRFLLPGLYYVLFAVGQSRIGGTN